MPSKISSEELNDILIESVVLSTLLLEKFEIMEENKLTAFKAKQSLKATIGYLQNYVNKVFDVKGEKNLGYIELMKEGASNVAEIVNRVETALKSSNLLSISERKETLHAIIGHTQLDEAGKAVLYEKIRDSGIIDY